MGDTPPGALRCAALGGSDPDRVLGQERSPTTWPGFEDVRLTCLLRSGHSSSASRRHRRRHLRNRKSLMIASGRCDSPTNLVEIGLASRSLGEPNCRAARKILCSSLSSLSSPAHLRVEASSGLGKTLLPSGHSRFPIREPPPPADL